MSELEEKLNTILNDPQAMQQIMNMAQSLSAEGGQNPFPDIDIGMLQKLSGFAKQGNIDKDQRALLKALTPYLTRERLGKLEKAMRAAQLARAASGLLGSGGLQPLIGR